MNLWLQYKSRNLPETIIVLCVFHFCKDVCMFPCTKGLNVCARVYVPFMCTYLDERSFGLKFHNDPCFNILRSYSTFSNHVDLILHPELYTIPWRPLGSFWLFWPLWPDSIWSRIWPSLVSMERSGKCRSPMKTELKKLQRLKSYSQIKIYTEIRANFLCIMALKFQQAWGTP